MQFICLLVVVEHALKQVRAIQELHKGILSGTSFLQSKFKKYESSVEYNVDDNHMSASLYSV